VSAWTGVVLAGGASRRMGRDKARLEIGGEAMARRAATALAAAGAAEVFCMGGDAGALSALGIDVRPDEHPGEGPLGAVVTAIHLAAHDTVMVLACDVIEPAPRAIAATVTALEEDADADAAIPTDGRRLQPLHAAYRRRCGPVLAGAFAEGERSIARVLSQLRLVTVTGVDPVALADADTPKDLPAGGGR